MYLFIAELIIIIELSQTGGTGPAHILIKWLQVVQQMTITSEDKYSNNKLI